MTLGDLFDALDLVITANNPVFSFCILGIVILISILFFSGYVFGSVCRKVRRLGKIVKKEADKRYLSRAWGGWLLGLLGFAFIECAFLEVKIMFNRLTHGETALLGLLLIVLAYLVNFKLYCEGVIRIIKENLEVAKK